MNELQITGILTKKCDIEKGVSKAGKEYQNKTFVVEIPGQYPKSIAFVLFGDRTSYVDNFNEGDELTVKFSIESREFNNRFFTNVNAYSVQRLNETANKPVNLPPSEMATKEPIQDEPDDLPF